MYRHRVRQYMRKAGLKPSAIRDKKTSDEITAVSIIERWLAPLRERTRSLIHHGSCTNFVLGTSGGDDSQSGPGMYLWTFIIITQQLYSRSLSTITTRDLQLMLQSPRSCVNRLLQMKRRAGLRKSWGTSSRGPPRELPVVSYLYFLTLNL